MALKTLEIETEIKKIQSQMNMGEGKITKAIKSLDKLKQSQQKLVDKQKQLQAAKINLTRYNKAG